MDHASDGRDRGADALDVDVIVPQCFEHVACDHLAFFKIKAGDAHQGDLVVLDDGTAADHFVDFLRDLKGGFKVVPVNANHDVIALTLIEEMHNQFHVDP